MSINTPEKEKPLANYSYNSGKKQIKLFVIKNKSIELLLLQFCRKNGTLDDTIPDVNCKNATIIEGGGGGAITQSQFKSDITILHKLFFVLALW